MCVLLNGVYFSGKWHHTLSPHTYTIATTTAMAVAFTKDECTLAIQQNVCVPKIFVFRIMSMCSQIYNATCIKI